MFKISPLRKSIPLHLAHHTGFVKFNFMASYQIQMLFPVGRNIV